ncbi:hypothetical protein [Pseudomonas mandelii]|uniref:hypothetical protein n=1 Tax=Pseudomonas mandelii TaxID=75612 RepID=UPI003C785E4B
MANPWDALPDVKPLDEMPWDSLPDVEVPPAAPGNPMEGVPAFLRPVNQQPKAPTLYAANPSVPVATAPASNPWDELPDVELPDRTAGQWATDIGGSIGRGAYNLFDSLAGIGDIASGGAVTPWLAAHGLDSKAARQVLENEMSPQARAQREEVQNADGFVDTAKAMALNPAYTAGMALETLAPMVVGGVAGRGAAVGARALGLSAGKAAAIGTGAGEGVLSAGQQAAQTVQQTGDLTPEQTALALGSGALTGAIGAGAGQLARRFGVTDLDAALAGQAAPQSGAGLLGRILGGFGSEGTEEVLQSAQEQVAQNLALGRPAMEGVSNAAAQGGVLGAMMGGAAAGVGGLNRDNYTLTPAEQARAAAAVAAANNPAPQPAPAGGLQSAVQIATGQTPAPAVPFAGSKDINPLLDNLGLGPAEKIKAVALLTPAEDSIWDARRGVVPLAEQQRLAGLLGASAKQIAAGRKVGQAWSAEEHIAVTSMVSKRLQGILETQNAIAGNNATDAQKAQFINDVAEFSDIAGSLLGARAEAGRALAAQRRQMHNSRDIANVLESVGGAQTADELAAALGQAIKSGGIGNAAKLMADKRPGLFDFYYRSALLSGFRTHEVNAISNTAMLANSIIERGIASTIATAKRAVGLNGQTVYSEPVQLLLGMVQNFSTAAVAARNAATDPDSNAMLGLGGGTSENLARPRGALENTFSVPFRGLAASDAMFAQLNYGAEMRALATRKSHSEKARGALPQGVTYAQRVNQLTANPTPEMVEAAHDYAREQTFNTKAGKFASALIAVKAKAPWLNLVIPFVRTPANIIHSALKRTPVAPIYKDVRADLAAGGHRQEMATAKILWGTTMMVGAGLLSQAGLLSGSGPADEKEKRALLATGWKPNSIKVGDTWYQYNRIDPFAIWLSMAADIVSIDKTKDASEIAAQIAASFAANLSSKTFIKGAADFAEFLADPNANAATYLRKQGATMAQPFTVLSNYAAERDPYARETSTLWDAIKYRTPGLRESLPVKIDQFGRPVQDTNYSGGAASFLNPIPSSAETNNPVRQEAARLKWAPSKPENKFTIAKREVEMNPQQYQEFMELSGIQTYVLLSQVMNKPEYQNAGDEGRRRVLDKMADLARQMTKANMARAVVTGDRSGLDKLRQNLKPTDTEARP